ncbi:MAG: ABC transporter ATP-binding protein [Nitrososphaerota archaeon]
MIVVQNLEKSFTGPDGRRLPVLKNVDLEVKRGEFFSIVGPSGCGKTTLLRIIAGISNPDGGRIFIDGSEVNGPSKDVGFVFQTFNLLPWRTVLKNIEFGLEVRGVPSETRRQTVFKYLKLVGLEGFENFYPRQISGGMMQRAAIARALAIEPKVLLMDEPLANLDAQTREYMQSELLKIWRETGKTILFVTHNIDEAVYLSDRVALFSSRPGAVMEIMDIDLPRPRTEEIKLDNRFMMYRSHIWERIKEYVKKAMTAHS